MQWIRVTRVENIPLREGRCVRIGDKEIAIFRLPDRVLAIDNACPHNQGPLCDGITAQASVICPLHGWKICLETGRVLRPDVPVGVRTYAVRVENGVIELNPRALVEEDERAA